MSLQERLVGELREAMRRQDATRRSTLRLLRAAIHNEEIAQGKPLDDVGVVGIIARQVWQHQESIEAYRKGNRPDLVTQEESELAILREYLPEPLSRDEIVALAGKVIQEVGAAGPGDLGKVMSRLMPQARGRAEGAEVSKVVAELLQG